MTEKEIPTRGHLSGAAVLALGFRPFYLMAGLFAAVTMVYWLVFYLGGTQLSGNYLAGIVWHSHEMVFGYGAAVIAGFLLTAVRNWTGQSTPVGPALAALVMLWLLGRVSVLTGPSTLAAWLDISFFPALCLVIAVPIWNSRNQRNYKIAAVLLALTLANTAFHLAVNSVVPGHLQKSAITAALDMITILMAIVGGRVIPAFTASALPCVTPRRLVGVEIVAVGSLVLILMAGIVDVFFHLPGSISGTLLITASVANLVRLLLWMPHRTLGNPLLLMLPVAYLWIPISLGFRALAAAGTVVPATAAHALTIGAIGGMTLAMMMRSALGHTGRDLKAGLVENTAFLMVQVAALARVSGEFVKPEYYRYTLMASGLLWSLAFVAFLSRYGAILTRPRIDGKPG